MNRATLGVVVSCVLLARAAGAGQEKEVGAGSPHADSRPLGHDGPPAPIPPEVISRNSAGQATVRAVRLTGPIRIDGKLDDAPATEQTK